LKEIDLKKVEAYFSGKIRSFGATPAGVDWNGEASQRLRFQQFTRLLPRDCEFTLLDYGCGYGAFADFLRESGFKAQYTGYDFSKVMIDSAKERRLDCVWTQSEPASGFDFVVASGLFNIKLGYADEQWGEYILEILQRFRELGREGFGYNMLTSYVDTRREDLYYADPSFHFEYCKRKFSKDVALLHDYGLYDFTMLVGKSK
jgi:SAM-dependent methyltransferase